MTSKEVAKQEAKDLAVEMAGFDFGTDIGSKDIVIPKILSMQGQSTFVTDGKATMGDFVDSLTGNKLGDIENPIEVIPFHLEKLWINTSKLPNEQRFKFDFIEKITPQNEDRAWEETIGGRIVRHDYTWNFYVLLPEEVKAGNAMPYMISFRRTSARGGKKLLTHMYVKNRAAKRVPFADTCIISGKRESNDHGTFIVLDTKGGRDSSKQEVEEAFKWFKIVQKGGAKVDHSDVQTSNDNKSYAKDNVEF